MLGQEGAGRVAAKTVHHVVDPIGHPGLLHDLTQQRSGSRRLLGGFDHYGIAAGQRRADLPGHQQQRQVPRTDHTDHALGPANRVVERTSTVRRCHLECLGGNILDQVGEYLEVGGATRNVDMAGQRTRLAGVQTFGFEELIKARGDAIGNPVQDGRALLDRHLSPRPFQRRPRCAHGGINFLAPGFVHLAEHSAVGRVDIVEQPTAGRADVRAVDVMLDFFHG